MKVSIIAAISDPGRIIGTTDGEIPWYLPEDFKHFKNITFGKPMIMGRKTWESILKKTGGKPLPGRMHIIVTRDLEYDPGVSSPNVSVAHCPMQALDMAIATDEKEVFIIGGGEIYKAMMSYANYLYLTIIHGNFEGDVTFPEYAEQFPNIDIVTISEYKGIEFEFVELTR